MCISILNKYVLNHGLFYIFEWNVIFLLGHLVLRQQEPTSVTRGGYRENKYQIYYGFFICLKQIKKHQIDAARLYLEIQISQTN